MFESKKILLIVLVTFGLIGCSEPEPVEIDIDEAAANVGLAPEDYEVDENGAIEVYSKVDTTKDSVAWYQDDLSETVENVGMLDAEAILASAGLEPDEIEESADTEGQPKKLYVINDETPLSALFSHSPNSIELNWYQFSDKPETTENSQQSLKDTYKLARAMAGREGAEAVMYLSNGGKYRSKPVGGYPVTGQCNDGVCFIHIDLSDV